ncbi:hypothetical protein K458DRAFT_382980 [Lentithecium fluviatile CBS 122367]|uniref:Uncharacterized protein n=1 Tax=Lentithecium fluviatile CBS 122367 TaxID=1168545 RepID=A0A6G1JH26_9PLEO|nr:hypothetical protein K458DRAFT_382980 [Lentithecium fluviatile CBS 122367]
MNSKKGSSSHLATDTPLSPRQSKKTKATSATASPMKLTATPSPKDRSEAERRVHKALTPQDRITYNGMYSSPRKMKGRPQAAQDKAVQRLREFLVARPEALKLHNDFAMICNTRGKQGIPVPTFFGLEKRDDTYARIADNGTGTYASAPTFEDVTGQGPMTDDKQREDRRQDASFNNTTAAGNCNRTQRAQTQASLHERITCNSNTGQGSMQTESSNVVDRGTLLAPFHGAHIQRSLFTGGGPDPQDIMPSKLNTSNKASNPQLGAQILTDTDEDTDEVDIETMPSLPFSSTGRLITFSGDVEIKNPQAFQLPRIRNLAHTNPSTEILRIVVSVAYGNITHITVDLDKSIVDDFIITDERMFDRLGLGPWDNNFDTIRWNKKLDCAAPSFVLRLDAQERADGTLGGELEIPRHSYLAWLDYIKKRFPLYAPSKNEVIHVLAPRLGFKLWVDCMKEVRDAWELEQGQLGDYYRNNRLLWLWEDPRYE